MTIEKRIENLAIAIMEEGLKKVPGLENSLKIEHGMANIKVGNVSESVPMDYVIQQTINVDFLDYLFKHMIAENYFRNPANSKEEALSMVRYRLINEKKLKPNDGMASVKRFNDTDIRIMPVFYKEGIAAVPVSKEYMNKYNISDKELHDACYKNMQNESYVIKNVNELIWDLLIRERIGQEDIEKVKNFIENNKAPFYVLRPKSESLGAAIILNNKVIEELKKKLEHFILVPASVEEFLVFPINESANTKDFEDRIMEAQEMINKNDVAPDKFLSNQIIRF